MIFLDSSFLIALEVATDQNHEKARIMRDKIIVGEFGDAIISDYIFDETVTVTLNKTKDMKKTKLVGENLKKSAEIKMTDRDIFEDSWEIFANQKKTKFSFTDCTILSIMLKDGVKNLATFDKEFEKIEGIRIIR